MVPICSLTIPLKFRLLGATFFKFCLSRFSRAQGGSVITSVGEVDKDFSTIRMAAMPSTREW